MCPSHVGGFLQVSEEVNTKQRRHIFAISFTFNCPRRVSNADVVLFVNNPVPERHARIAEETRVTCKDCASVPAVNF